MIDPWPSGSSRAAQILRSLGCPGRHRSRSGAMSTSCPCRAACHDTSCASSGWARGCTPSRRRRSLWQPGSTVCCETCTGSGCRLWRRRRLWQVGSMPRATNSRRPWSPNTWPSPCPIAACSPGASPPTTCRCWSTQWWCCWCGSISPASIGVTCRCRTCCSVARRGLSRRTSWTPRPASCVHRSPTGCATTT